MDPSLKHHITRSYLSFIILLLLCAPTTRSDCPDPESSRIWIHIRTSKMPYKRSPLIISPTRVRARLRPLTDIRRRKYYLFLKAAIGR